MLEPTHTLVSPTAQLTLDDFMLAPSILGLSDNPSGLGGSLRYQRVTAQAVYEAGVGEQDLTAFAAVCCHAAVFDLDYASMVLLSYLNNLTETASDLPLRDALNWCMVADLEKWSTGYAVSEFTELGVRTNGWLFLAAGVEPQEAASILREHGDAIPHQTLKVMAALRGTRLLPGSLEAA